MDKKKIYNVLTENPELHVRLVEALTELAEKVGESIDGGKLVEALKETGTRESTHEEFVRMYL